MNDADRLQLKKLINENKETAVDQTNLIRQLKHSHILRDNVQSLIDLNKITDKLFKLLIPDSSEEDIKEFFEYKNNPEDPKHFNVLEDFKKYIVSIGNIMNESDFDQRFAKDYQKRMISKEVQKKKTWNVARSCDMIKGTSYMNFT